MKDRYNSQSFHLFRNPNPNPNPGMGPLYSNVFFAVVQTDLSFNFIFMTEEQVLLHVRKGRVR